MKIHLSAIAVSLLVNSFQINAADYGGEVNSRGLNFPNDSNLRVPINNQLIYPYRQGNDYPYENQFGSGYYKSQKQEFQQQVDKQRSDPLDSSPRVEVYDNIWNQYNKGKPSDVAPDDAVVGNVRDIKKEGGGKEKIPKDRSPWLITIDDFQGGQLVGHYIGSGMGVAELNKRKEETRGCKGGLDEGSVDGCFAGLDPKYSDVYPETLKRQTYLRALSDLSSIVNSKMEHVCAISVYKKGVWVTAKHCINQQNKVLVDNILLPLAEAKITDCGNGCDVAFVEMKTPEKAEIPTELEDQAVVNWDVDIFVPSMPEYTNISDVLQGSNGYDLPDPESVKAKYNKDVIWSPYGQGFCMVLKQFPNGCLVHSCNSVGGFSGAPVYSYDKAANRIILLGIHSGSDPALNGCVAENTPKTNYAKLITRSGVRK